MPEGIIFNYNSDMERIQKLLSQAGVASRRNAEEMIKAGRITVNNKIAQLGDKATFNDIILVDGKPIIKDEIVYYMMNKPKQTICTLKDPQGRTKVVDLINDSRHIFTVGRLDYNTTGTIIITNDGDLSNKLTHPSFEVKRVYRARLNEPLSKQDLIFLNSQRVIIDNKKSVQTVEKADTKTYIITLALGSYHHVKKLFELVNKTVVSLTRIEFAGLTHVGKLKKGEYRQLMPNEVRWLKKLTNK